MYFEAILDSTMREVRIFMLPDEEGRLPERETGDRKKAAPHQRELLQRVSIKKPAFSLMNIGTQKNKKRSALKKLAAL